MCARDQRHCDQSLFLGPLCPGPGTTEHPSARGVPNTPRVGWQLSAQQALPSVSSTRRFSSLLHHHGHQHRAGSLCGHRPGLEKGPERITGAAVSGGCSQHGEVSWTHRLQHWLLKTDGRAWHRIRGQGSPGCPQELPSIGGRRSLSEEPYGSGRFWLIRSCRRWGFHPSSATAHPLRATEGS